MRASTPVDKEMLTTTVLYFNKETKCSKNNDVMTPRIVKILEWQLPFLQQFMGRAYPEK